MALLFFGILVAILAGSAMVMFVTRMRLIDSDEGSNMRLPDADRYRPMLRLLSDADLDFASTSPVLRSKIRARRREMFRAYLQCLTKDYGRLLSGVRRIMVDSGVDRPDLAKALAKSRVSFALALCNIEFHLQLHAIGVGQVDVSSVVDALDALRGAVGGLTPGRGYSDMLLS